MNQQNGAQASLRWALQTIATELKVEVDTERLHSITRAALTAEHGGTITKSQIIDAARALRLEAVSEESTLLSSAQADTALPLIVLTGAGLLVVSGSRGSTVHFFRQGGPPGGEWLDAAAFGAAYPGQLPMVRFSSAAPMQDLAAVSHHATPWQRLAALMHLERDDLNVIVIYAVAVGVLSLATPIAVQALVTTVAFGKLLQPVVVLALMLMATLAFAAVLKALQAQVVETLQQRLFVRTALDLAWRLPKAHRAQADSGFGPEAVNRFFDVVTLQKTSALLLTDGVAAALQMTLGLLVLAFYHPALLALDLLIVASAVALVALPFRRGLKTSLDESRGKYAVAAWLQELSRTSSSFRSTAGGMLATETAEVLTRNYLSGRRRHFSVVFGQTAASLALQVIARARCGARRERTHRMGQRNARAGTLHSRAGGERHGQRLERGRANRLTQRAL